MEKKKVTIPFFAVLIMLFSVIIAGIIVTAFCGINLGFNEAGGTQIRVDLSQTTLEKANKAVTDELYANKICIDSAFVEDKELTSYLVVSIADKNIENIDAVKAVIASKLGVDQTYVTSTVVKSTIHNNTYLAIGLVVIGLIVALFLFGLFRYHLAGGLALAFSFLVQVMLSLAVVFCTRLQLSIAGIIVILVSALILALFAVIMLEKYRANTLGKSLSNGEEASVMSNVTKSMLEPFLFTIAGLLLLAIVMLFTDVNRVLFIDAILVVSIAVLAFNMLLVLPKTHVSISEIARLREAAHLSKNNSPAPAKKKSK